MWSDNRPPADHAVLNRVVSQAGLAYLGSIIGSVDVLTPCTAVAAVQLQQGGDCCAACKLQGRVPAAVMCNLAGSRAESAGWCLGADSSFSIQYFVASTCPCVVTWVVQR